MDYRACIQRTIDYIESHLQHELSAEALARRAGFSAFHFYRLFNAYTGLPIMEYIRRRRLAYAVADLAQGRRIIDIALDYGFETHNGFTKAFRKTYGSSPDRYRQHGSGQIPRKIDLLLLNDYNLKGAIVMEPTIVHKPAFKVAGYELKTTVREGLNAQEIPAFWARMTDEHFDTLHKKLHSVGQHELGLCYPSGDESGAFSYVIAVEVSDFIGVPADMFTAELSEAVYAVFTTPANYHDGNIAPAIQGTWRYVFDTWFPTSGYELVDGKVDFEWYGKDEITLYIPVVKK